MSDAQKMAFVPGHTHDLFLSYAHDEAAWVDAFRKALCDEFHIRTGQHIKVWQDARNLRTGQNWTAEIEDGIRNAAAFLAIVSPIYHNRPWCKRERDIVLENKLEALKVDSFYRLLKIIKTPGPGNAHYDLLGDLEPSRFFSEADGYEFPAGSPEFTAQIRELFRHLRDLLTLMSNKSRQVYLAPPAYDMRTEHSELECELKDRGFSVKPDVLLSEEYGPAPVRQAMDRVSHVVMVLAEEWQWNEFTVQQIHAARDLAKPVVFWIRPGAAYAATLSRIDALRDRQTSEVLGGHSIREMIPQLLAKLKPPQPAEPVTANPATPCVYLNYDATLPGESRAAARIANLIRERHLDVVESGRDGDHDRLMQISSGVLVFRAARTNPDHWLREYARELASASQIFAKNPDYAAKALLVAEPSHIPARASSVPVYPWADPFTPETLEPFFRSMNQGRAANAGNAGR